MRRVTSRSLGTLAPGYAATRRGYTAYTALVGDVGLIAVAIDLSTRWSSGIWLVIGTAALFVIGSVAVLAGEVRTYRALKR